MGEKWLTSGVMYLLLLPAYRAGRQASAVCPWCMAPLMGWISGVSLIFLLNVLVLYPYLFECEGSVGIVQ